VDGLEELEKELAKFEKQQRLQKEWGCKFQVAAEPLLKEMGYTIVRAQHRIFTSLGERRRGWKWYMEKLGDYLWNYADYVVKKRGRVYVVDVKSQGYIPPPKSLEIDPYTPDTISFTEDERREYPISKLPILILLVLYNWGGKFTKQTRHGLPIEGIWEYSEKPNIRRLGVLFYKLVSFSDIEFREGASGGILGNKFRGCRKLPSRDVYALLQKTNAVDVVEIGPGNVTREKDGRRVVEGLSPS